MTRLPRLDLPDIPQHIVQRGNNRLPCFLNDDDRSRYLTLLREALQASNCALHAYALMDNHVHLLVTPAEKRCVARMMQKLARQYSSTFNARHQRTGTLWEGRYKACLVDSENYVLRCHRYIDLNPVRARMIDDPAKRCQVHLHSFDSDKGCFGSPCFLGDKTRAGVIGRISLPGYTASVYALPLR